MVVGPLVVFDLILLWQIMLSQLPRSLLFQTPMVPTGTCVDRKETNTFAISEGLPSEVRTIGVDIQVSLAGCVGAKDKSRRGCFVEEGGREVRTYRLEMFSPT